MKIAEELPKDLKENLIDIIIIYYNNAEELLKLA